jgi:tRNA pseudouridine55 synthase
MPEEEVPAAAPGRSTAASPRAPRRDRPGQAARGPRPELDGIIVVGKPPGPTSHDVVAIVRRLTGVRRVGHGGTLDPFAAGVLPVFLGHATRIVEYHLADEKAYRAIVVFGASSTTDDRDGELAPSEGSPPDRAAVEAALEAFRGTIEQVPPDHSAVHIGGRRAYELARHGRKPELVPRQVTIHELTLTAWDERDPERPAATLEVRCSAGTYVRALARDLGVRLGSGAYLGALTRTASGPFRLERATPLEEVRARLAEGRAAELLLPPDTGLEAMPTVTLAPDDLASLARGQVVRARGAALPALGPEALVRVVAKDGRLDAIARVEGGRLHPEKVFARPDR